MAMNGSKGSTRDSVLLGSSDGGHLHLQYRNQFFLDSCVKSFAAYISHLRVGFLTLQLLSACIGSRQSEVGGNDIHFLLEAETKHCQTHYLSPNRRFENIKPSLLAVS